jgi:hypothetical protein
MGVNTMNTKISITISNFTCFHFFCLCMLFLLLLISPVSSYSGKIDIYPSPAGVIFVSPGIFNIHWSYTIYTLGIIRSNVSFTPSVPIGNPPPVSLKTTAETDIQTICSNEGGSFAWVNSWTDSGPTSARNYSCNFHTGASCNLDGIIIPDGGSRIAYDSPSSSSCNSQVRTCTNGALNGSNSFSHASCSISTTPSCISKRINSTFSGLATAVFCLDSTSYISAATATPTVAIYMNASSPLSQAQLQLQYRLAPHSGSPIFSSWSSSLSPFTVHSSSTNARIEISYCGDGIVQSPEDCDSSPGCTVDCKQYCWSDATTANRPCMQSGFCETLTDSASTQCESWVGPGWDGILAPATLTCEPQSSGRCAVSTLIAPISSQCIEGMNGSIADPFIHDNGNSGVGDDLDWFCRGGLYRFCLSKEGFCPWRGNVVVTGSVDETCATYSIRVPTLPTWMATYDGSSGPWDKNGAYSFYCTPTSGGYGRISYGFSRPSFDPPADTGSGGVNLP